VKSVANWQPIWPAKKICDLDIPDGAHLVAVLRQEDQMLIPRKSLSLEEDDQILILAEDSDILEEAQKRFNSGDEEE